ncbi:MAG: hypothetical protein GY804_10945 [Alphaproteobacteria bacterium]|nr:hypothetical protein [Alphaproteobacteria bacterium]
MNLTRQQCGRDKALGPAQNACTQTVENVRDGFQRLFDIRSHQNQGRTR